MNQRDPGSDDNERQVSGLRIYKAQPAPEPSPGDYGLMEIPGAPAHFEAMLLGWRFSHAVIYVGDGRLVEAWFDRVRERDVAEYRVHDICWFGVRWAPDGSRVMQSRRARVAEYAVSRLGQLYDYLAWPAVYLRYVGGMDLSGLYVFDPLATCSALVARAYQAAGLDLVDKPVLNLVTPADLDPQPRDDRKRPGPRWPIPWRRGELPVTAGGVSALCWPADVDSEHDAFGFRTAAPASGTPNPCESSRTWARIGVQYSACDWRPMNRPMCPPGARYQRTWEEPTACRMLRTCCHGVMSSSSPVRGAAGGGTGHRPAAWRVRCRPPRGDRRRDRQHGHPGPQLVPSARGRPQPLPAGGRVRRTSPAHGRSEATVTQ